MRIPLTYTYCFRTKDFDVEGMKESGLILDMMEDPRDPAFTIVVTVECADNWFS